MLTIILIYINKKALSSKKKNHYRPVCSQHTTCIYIYVCVCIIYPNKSLTIGRRLWQCFTHRTDQFLVKSKALNFHLSRHINMQRLSINFEPNSPISSY